MRRIPFETMSENPLTVSNSESHSGGVAAGEGSNGLGWPAALVSLVSGASGMVNFFLPIYLKSALGFSGAQIGWLCGVYSLTTVLATVPIGLFNDRTSPRVIIALSLATASAGGLAMAEVKGFVFFLIAYTLYGLGLASFRLSLDALVFKTGETKRSGARWGYLNGFRMGSLGIGTFCAGYVLSQLGFPGGLALQAGILLAGLLMVPRLRPVKAAIPILRDYLSDLRQPGVAGFITWLFLFSLHWGAELTSYGLFLTQNLGLSLSAMGWYMGVEFVVLAATCLWAGPRCDRAADHRLLIVGGLLLSGTSQILMCVPEVWFSLFWRSVHGIGDGVILVVMYAGIARLFDLGRIGGHNSGVNLVMMIGTFFGSLVFGPVGEKFGYQIPLAVTGALVALLAVPILHSRNRCVSSVSPMSGSQPCLSPAAPNERGPSIVVK
jgi:MFS family permease